MKAQELRIGNYVMRNDKVFQVDFITPTIHNLEKYQPIRLDSDWLNKLGFHKIGDCFAKGEMICHIEHDRFEYWGIFLRPIKYVHELQNLCFALTGQQL